MENVIALVGLAALLTLTLPIALGLVWLLLEETFRLLPGAPRKARHAHEVAGQSAKPAWVFLPQDAATAAHRRKSPRAFQAGLGR